MACPRGCSWLAEFADGTGVCSSCPEWLDVEEPAPSLILPGDPEFDIRLAKARAR